MKSSKLWGIGWHDCAMICGNEHVGILLEMLVVVHHPQISHDTLTRALPLDMVNVAAHKGKVMVSVEWLLKGMEVIAHSLEALWHHMVQEIGQTMLNNNLAMRDGFLEVMDL